MQTEPSFPPHLLRAYLPAACAPTGKRVPTRLRATFHVLSPPAFCPATAAHGPVAAFF